FYNPVTTSFDNSATGANFPIATTLSALSVPTYEWVHSTIIPIAVFVDDQYNIESKATDNAGNFEVVYNTATFIIDKSSPTTTIQMPADNNAYSAGSPLTNITGTSNDPNAFPSGVNRVQLSVV